jgi:hypothetical protein
VNARENDHLKNKIRRKPLFLVKTDERLTLALVGVNARPLHATADETKRQRKR